MFSGPPEFSEDVAEFPDYFEEYAAAGSRTAFLGGQGDLIGDSVWGGPEHREFLPGDPYAEPKNSVHRGTDPASNDQWHSLSGLHMLDNDSSFFDMSKMGGKYMELLAVEPEPNSDSEDDELIEDDFAFSPHCMRLRVAGDYPLGTVAATHVSELVRSYLKMKGTASIKEVRLQEFSIKADVFHEIGGVPLHCSLKARIFKSVVHPDNSGGQDPQQLVVKLNHQKGDSMVFSRVCDEAARYLQANFHQGSVTVESAKTGFLACKAIPMEQGPWVPGIEDMETGPELVQPLLDMLSSNEPSFQAEALTSLIPIVAANAGGALSIIEGLREMNLTSLFGSGDLTVSYPAACLASRIAEFYRAARAEAGECAYKPRGSNEQALLDGGSAYSIFLRTAFQDAKSSGADQLVIAELAKASRTLEKF